VAFRPPVTRGLVFSMVQVTLQSEKSPLFFSLRRNPKSVGFSVNLFEVDELCLPEKKIKIK
jgi:hypothetical protein